MEDLNRLTTEEMQTVIKCIKYHILFLDHKVRNEDISEGLKFDFREIIKKENDLLCKLSDYTSYRAG